MCSRCLVGVIAVLFEEKGDNVDQYRFRGQLALQKLPFASIPRRYAFGVRRTLFFIVIVLYHKEANLASASFPYSVVLASQVTLFGELVTREKLRV
jgi:hypothetical protein